MGLLNPTSFAEIARLHRSVLSTFKGTLVVTCTQAGEGASLFTYLLAQRSAEEGKKTLVLDLNLKNTQLTKTLELETVKWDLANGRKKVTSLLKNVHKADDNLDILPAPSDLESTRWLCDVTQARKFFHDLGEAYDQIIVDTTPLFFHQPPKCGCRFACSSGRPCRVGCASWCYPAP